MKFIIETYGELAIAVIVTAGIIGFITALIYSPDLLQKVISLYTNGAC